ncbi:MAG: lycopene cyclase domain-containing protein [Ignavibacteria bacterium]|nr:lycopene cyclase domain-containing protein [Ignavibacteria bacterium]
MKIEYSLILAIALAGPLVLSFSKELTIYRSARRLLLSVALPLPVFLAWDMIVTARGHWSFNSSYVIGVYVGNLPLEEVLFFVVIPFCAIFTWESVKYFLREKR